MPGYFKMIPNEKQHQVIALLFLTTRLLALVYNAAQLHECFRNNVQDLLPYCSY